MCGISGFFGNGTLDDLCSMNSVMIHRGPDEEGYWYDEKLGVYLGHRRLSVIDIQGGKQPMLTTDGELVLVYNGEIYNHLELRQKLEAAGHKFQSDHSDTEVLLHGYEEWGNRLPTLLNGMWAFALFDKKRKIIFLSRDRFAKKPLFYALQNSTFAFASELSALVRHTNITAYISRRSVKKYFAYGYIPAPHTIYENIYKLSGGCNLFFCLPDFQESIQRYWDFDIQPFDSIPDKPEIVWGEQIGELIDRAVKRRMMADVPLGVFLSGGIDSTALTAFAAGHVTDAKIKTFSIGFEEDSFDESPYAQRASDLLMTDHHLETLSFNRALELLPEIVSKLDEPMGDSSLLPTFLLCRETRKCVTVAISGDGCDELFAGYDPFHVLKIAELYSKIVPRPVHKAIQIAAASLPVSHRNMSLDFRIKQSLRGLTYEKRLWWPVWHAPLEPKELNELFEEPVDIEDVYSEAITCWESCRQDNIVDQTLNFYTKLYLQDDMMVKTDRASMMNSLEVRAPYLDIELVDFVRRIPWQYKYRNGVTKYILKKSLENILPKDIVYRGKKGFGLPVGKWFQEEVLQFHKDLFVTSLNDQFVHNKIREHILFRRDNRLFLWNYYVLSQYLNNCQKSL